jgi:hypothetical protein
VWIGAAGKVGVSSAFFVFEHRVTRLTGQAEKDEPKTREITGSGAREKETREVGKLAGQEACHGV